MTDSEGHSHRSSDRGSGFLSSTARPAADMLRVYTRPAERAGCRLSAVTADVTRRCPRGAGGCTRPGTAVPRVRHEERGGAGRQPRQASRGEGAARWGFVGRGHRQLWQAGGRAATTGTAGSGTRHLGRARPFSPPAPRPVHGRADPAPPRGIKRVSPQTALERRAHPRQACPDAARSRRADAPGTSVPAPPPILVPERRSGSSCAGAPQLQREFLP